MKLYEIYQPVSEALSMKQYRYIKDRINKFDARRYSEIFDKYPHYGKSYRIYIDADGVNMGGNRKSSTQINVEDYLSQNGYEVVDYRANKAIKKEVEQPAAGNLSPEDLEKRRQRQQNRKPQELRIGKILQKLHPTLYQQYVKDNETKKNAKDSGLLVCISRHPYDVGSMSSGQSWSSCTNIEGGANRHYVPAEIEAGTIVAYLIREDDKKLKKPLARVLIMPFVSKDDRGEFIFQPSNRVYPTEYQDTGFLQRVIAWCKEVNNMKELKSGVFFLGDDHYGEVDSSVLVVSKEKLIDYLRNGDIDYFESATQELKKDPEVLAELKPLLAGRLSDGYLFYFHDMPKLFQDDPDILNAYEKGILRRANTGQLDFYHYPKFMLDRPKIRQAYRNTVIDQLTKGGGYNNYEYVVDDLKDDPEILTALKIGITNGMSSGISGAWRIYKDLPDSIRRDENVMHGAREFMEWKFNGGYLELYEELPDFLKEYPGMVEAFKKAMCTHLSQGALHNFKYVPTEMQDDDDIIEAYKDGLIEKMSEGSLYRYGFSPERVKQDKRVVMAYTDGVINELSEGNFLPYETAPESVQNNPLVKTALKAAVLHTAEDDPVYFDDLPDWLQKDDDVITIYNKLKN